MAERRGGLDGYDRFLTELAILTARRCDDPNCKPCAKVRSEEDKHE